MAQTPSEIEQDGRLIAHRMILKVLMQEVAAQSAAPERLWEKLEALCQFEDHEEDPGIVTSEAYGIEATAALEVRRMVEEAKGG